MNEADVGKGIKGAMEEGSVKRDDLFVATKLWHSNYSDPETALRKSLKALQLDYVDVYYIHWPNNFLGGKPIPMHTLYSRVEHLVDLGLARGIGVSNFNT
jgi:alcohol dehydrogenase (NADP+)